MENYNKINRELEKHSEHLANLYQIVALNKIDSVFDEEQEKFLEEFKKVAKDVFLISAATGQNIESIKHFISQKVDEIPKPVFDIYIEEDTEAYNNDDSEFEVIKVEKDAFAVVGGKINRLAQVTDARNLEQIIRLQNIFKNMGVFSELKRQGIKDGDTIVIGHLEMVYYNDEA